LQNRISDVLLLFSAESRTNTLTLTAPSPGKPPPDPAPDVVRAVEAVLSLPEAKLDHARAKVALDALVDPAADAAASLAEIDRLATCAQAMAGPDASAAEKLSALRTIIYRSGPWNGYRPFDYDHAAFKDIPVKLLSVRDLINQLIANAEEVRQHKFGWVNPFWFRDQVRNGGPWDYKQYDSAYQDFGNFNYGYTGAAGGFRLCFLQKEAGRAQVAAGTSRPEWGTPGDGSPYGDDPRDQEQIRRGYNDYRNGCYAR
jgi:hypothetical protein